MIKDIVNYLGFDGDCEAAFNFYEKALGGEIIAFFRYKDAPGDYQHSPEAAERIMHVTLQVGDKLIQGGDAPIGMHGGHSGYCINIVTDNNDDADKFFAALAEGGKINMPISETFWAHRFGMLIDKFGVPWMVNHPKPMN